MDEPLISDEELSELERLDRWGSAPPWRAMVEGRDHTSGDSFIMAGPESDRAEDIYVSRDSGPASPSDLDLIATARTYLPSLIAEIRHLRSKR
jgi:hypothetical protein